jgi:hypothetical protein
VDKTHVDDLPVREKRFDFKLGPSVLIQDVCVLNIKQKKRSFIFVAPASLKNETGRLRTLHPKPMLGPGWISSDGQFYPRHAHEGKNKQKFIYDVRKNELIGPTVWCWGVSLGMVA